MLSCFSLCFSQVQHIKLKYSGNVKKVKRAVEQANKILSDTAFYEGIRRCKNFDNTMLAPHEIADLMQNASQTIQIVVLPKPIANASTSTAFKTTVSIFNFSKNLKTAVNTLIHEVVHAVDWLNGTQEFTHVKNNNSDGSQDNTAPWVIGALAENLTP